MDKALIMARGHSTTQGLTDDVYLPKILNNPINDKIAAAVQLSNPRSIT